MTMPKRPARTLLAAVCSLTALGAAASEFPEKPVTFVVPFAAGSATDQLARALGASVSAQTGKAVVVENRAGASGMIAAQSVSSAKADGYRVLIATNTTHAANEHLYKKLPYDPVKDFAPITGLGQGGQVLVVKGDAPWKNVAELVAAARAQPGKLSFASGSASSRVAGELFQQLSGTKILHVPYKSNPLAITDLLGHHVDMMITDTSTGMPPIQSGALRALGVSTVKRLAILPQVPTIAEAGVAGYEMSYWFAAYAPAGTPGPVVNTLNKLLGSALKTEPVQAFFATSGGSPFPTTPAELAGFQRDEADKWGRIIRAAGIEPE